MRGCQNIARRAKANCPVIDHWVCVPLCPMSRPGRKHPRQPGRSRAATKVADKPSPAATFPQNPRNNTFYTFKPHPTMTQHIAANPRVVGRVTPCAPLLTFKPASYPSCHFPIALLLRNTLCKCLVLQHVTFAAKAPKMPVASPLASLSPQRGEGLRVRGGHIQSRLPSVSSCIRPIRGPGLKRNMLKEHNMQVPVFTICYTAANVPNPAGHAERDQKTPEISLFTD